MSDVRAEFDDTVTMTRRELERWLDTDESRSVGASGDGGESTEHASGRRIVEILGTRKDDLDEDGYAHMRTVVGDVRRHLAQAPKKESQEDSRWRYTLMNWGHDPPKTG